MKTIELPREPFLTPAELAARFRRSISTVRAWRRDGLQPETGDHPRPLYRESVTLAYLNGRARGRA